MSEKPQIDSKLLRVLKDPQDKVICTCRGSAQEVLRCIKSQTGWSVHPDSYRGNPPVEKLTADDSYVGNFKEFGNEDEPRLSQYDGLISGMQLCAEEGLFNLITRFPEKDLSGEE